MVIDLQRLVVYNQQYEWAKYTTQHARFYDSGANGSNSYTIYTHSPVGGWI